LIKISLSRYAEGRLSEELIEIISDHGISIEISNREAGRPSLIEKLR